MDYIELKEEMKKTKSVMTSSERLKKYFAGEEVDHIPYNLMSINNALCDIYGYTTKEMDNDFDIYSKITREARDQFGVEAINIPLNFRILGEAMGSTCIYPNHGIEQIKDYVLGDYDNWSKMDKADPYNNKILTSLLQTAAKTKERFPEMPLSTSVNGTISNAVSVRPIEKVLKDTRKNPRELKELIALVTDNSLRWVHLQMNLGESQKTRNIFI